MSLLMDALKKAEDAKSKSDEGPAITLVTAKAKPLEPEASVPEPVHVETVGQRLSYEPAELVSQGNGKDTLADDDNELEFVIESVEALDDDKPVIAESSPNTEQLADALIKSAASFVDECEDKTPAGTAKPIAEPEAAVTTIPQPVAQPPEQEPDSAAVLSAHAAESKPIVETPVVQPQPQPDAVERSPEAPEAKSVQAVPTLIGKRKPHRAYAWGALAVLFVVAGLGYYFYALMAAMPAQLALETATAEPPSAEVAPESPVVVEAPLQIDLAESPASQGVNPTTTAVVKPPKTRVPDPAAEKPGGQVEKTQPVAAAPKQTPKPQLEITRTEKVEPIQRALTQAYRHYLQGDFGKAEHYYRIALNSDNSNRDALLGMAVIAQRQGQSDSARALYRRLLTLDPKDSVAATGLMSLPEAGPSIQNETRLKLMLEEEPTASHLHFSLGNEYASQSRWPEAQQSYFQAYRYDPENGDYAFNLAISLEQLGQSQAALSYYQRAQQAAGDGVVGFDRQMVALRIAALSQAESVK